MHDPPPAPGVTNGPPAVPPHAFDAWPEIARRLGDRTLALFFDYDGTLAPIAERPELARMPDEMRAIVSECARRWPVAVISGRARADVEQLVGLAQLTYAGSHGFEVSGPPGSNLRLEVDAGIVPRIEAAARELRERTASVPGVIVEEKRFSVAVHYRLASPADHTAIAAVVDDVVTRDPLLRRTAGKMVFEIRPAAEWDKGRAVFWLLEALGLDRTDVIPLFVGDDWTDEDAFRAIGPRGLTIVVMDEVRPTAARYRVRNVDEVRLLLERLARRRPS